MSATQEKPAAAKAKKSRPTHYMVREQVRLYQRVIAPDEKGGDYTYEEVEALIELGDVETANGPKAAIDLVLEQLGRDGAAGKFKAHPMISDKTHTRETETITRPLWK